VSPGSFAAALALLRLAFAAAPGETLRAGINRLRGKRQRAHTAIHRAAASHRGYYAAWIRHGEPCAFAAWSGASTLTEKARIAVVAADDAAGEEAVAKAGTALGDIAVVLPRGPAGAVLADAVRQGCGWLLPLSGQCCLSPRAGEALPTVAADDQAAVVYWDHDIIEAGRRRDPVLKPNWDPLLHAAIDLLRGAAMVRCDAAAEVVAAEPGLALADLPAAVALRGDAVRHVPLVLSHLASSELFRPAPARQTSSPEAGVSILIPTRDRVDLLATCLTGLGRLDYAGPVEIVVLDNDSRDPATLAFFTELAESGRGRVVACPGPFNFADLINRGAEAASHDVLCLLNNDIEPLDGEWLGRMVEHALLPSCGAVGARLLYPDGTVQHAGIAVGIGGAAGHIAKGIDPQAPQHRVWHAATRRVSAVTAACLVVERRKFRAIGGMDADSFAVDFNDVDFCLRLNRAGFENRLVAEAMLVHHESKSRGTVRRGEDQTRFERELLALRARWGTQDYRDPWFTPMFRTESQECLLRF
jgi:GT2 family glycosyltransferase